VKKCDNCQDIVLVCFHMLLRKPNLDAAKSHGYVASRFMGHLSAIGTQTLDHLLHEIIERQDLQEDPVESSAISPVSC
jgi:hypothetical protein